MRLPVLFWHEFCIVQFRQVVPFRWTRLSQCVCAVWSVSATVWVRAVPSFFGSWRVCYVSISRCFVQLDMLSVCVALYQCFCVLGICQRASSLFYSIVCSLNIMYRFAMSALTIVRLSFLTDTCPQYVPRVLQLSPHPWWGTRWRSWLRHCATSRKVAGSISDGVIGFFSLT